MACKNKKGMTVKKKSMLGIIGKPKIKKKSALGMLGKV